MKQAEIIEALRAKLAVPGGRHLYGVLGGFQALESFAATLQQASTLDGTPFPAQTSVNQGILDAIPDDEFKRLVEDEARRPEPTAAHVGQAFEHFLRAQLRGKGLVVLSHLELVFAYQLELSLLRSLAADDDRIILLLPGKRDHGRVVLFPDYDGGSYALPTNLIADNHLWELG